MSIVVHVPGSFLEPKTRADVSRGELNRSKAAFGSDCRKLFVKILRVNLVT